MDGGKNETIAPENQPLAFGKSTGSPTSPGQASIALHPSATHLEVRETSVLEPMGATGKTVPSEAFSISFFLELREAEAEAGFQFPGSIPVAHNGTEAFE